MKRIKLTHGSARVDENVTQQVVESLNEMTRKVKEAFDKTSATGEIATREIKRLGKELDVANK